MTASGIFQLVLYLVVLIALAKPLGTYMARVYQNQPFALGRALGWLERLIYRWSGVRPTEEMGWKTYAATMLLFNLFGLLAVYRSGVDPAAFTAGSPAFAPLSGAGFSSSGTSVGLCGT